MSVWKLEQNNLAGRRARFLIGVCGQCSTNRKDLLGSKQFGAKRSIQWLCQSTSFQKQAQFDTVSKKASNLPLLPCLNAASSPAQKVFALYGLQQEWVLKQSTKVLRYSTGE